MGNRITRRGAVFNAKWTAARRWLDRSKGRLSFMTIRSISFNLNTDDDARAVNMCNEESGQINGIRISKLTML